jgi:hypothetical protein
MDQLLARVWRSIELILFQTCMLEVGYLWPRWRVSLAKFYLLRLCLYILICVQRCQGFMTAMASGCGPVVSPMFGMRFWSPPREQQPRTSHLRANVGSCIVEWQYFDFASAMFLNSNTSLSLYLFCNSRIHIITFYSGHVCVYYASVLVNASVLTPRMDPD